MLSNVVVLVRIYLDRLIDYIFGLYYTNVRRVPPISDSLLLESATSLAHRIRQRQVSSEHLVKLFVERIKQSNLIINAVVEYRFEIAVAEAKQVDSDIRNNVVNFEEKPFLGVPFTAKDNVHCKGMKCTFGTYARKNVVADEDADVVLALKNAGAILLGVTNVPELGMWQETSNSIYGTTNNPYNTTRNVGGSSGGEAAVIAACGSPMGIGTDVGGSIRIPAFMCGIFGHKPSNDLISTKGMTFRKGTEGPTMVTAGTMTKFAEDIAPFLKVLVGKNVDKLKLDENVEVSKLNIYYTERIDSALFSSIGDEMKDALARTVNHFKQTSKSVCELRLDDGASAMKIWRYWLTQERNSNFFTDIVNRQGQINPFWELLRFLTCTGELNVYAIVYALSLAVLQTPDEKWARDVTAKLQALLLEKLGENGVLLFPSAPWSARYHYSSLLRPFNFAYFALWNALKMPVTQVPLGLDKEGLPIGIQVVAAPYQDHLCIAVAKELEKTFGGYVPPNKVNV